MTQTIFNVRERQILSQRKIKYLTKQLHHQENDNEVYLFRIQYIKIWYWYINILYDSELKSM